MKRYWFLLCVAVFLIAGGTVSAKENRTVIVSAGDKEFEIILADNEAADGFYQRLPMSLNMTELNGNEKYYYMDESLPTSASVPSRINTGDLMLYGSDCVVLFYKSFSTSYSYTELGHMANSSGLAAALGSGSVTVTFTKKVDEAKDDTEEDDSKKDDTEDNDTKGETETPVEKNSAKKSGLKESGSGEMCTEKHSHTYEWQITRCATVTQDGEMVYICTQCGEIEYRAGISAYSVFVDTVIDRINTAPADSILVVDAMQFVSFPQKVYEKLEERSDLTLEINFVYRGNAYTVTLPPNADFSELIDQNGYCGFLNLCTRFEWSISE